MVNSVKSCAEVKRDNNCGLMSIGGMIDVIEGAGESCFRRIWRFLDRGPFHNEFEGANPWKGLCINLNTYFEPLIVHIGPKLWPVGWPRKWEKEKKGGKESKKLLHFTTTWKRHFTTDLHQIWWVCRSYQGTHACQVWWFFQGWGGKKHFPFESLRP